LGLQRPAADGLAHYRGKILLGEREISSFAESGMRHIRGNEVGMVFQDPATSLIQ